MRIFLITPFGKDYPIAERVAEGLLDEGESVYNPAALYASPDAPVGNHLLLRETLPRLLDAEAVLYLPGWMSDPMALMHASIAQAINLIQWIPADPLPVLEEDEEYKEKDWEWVALDRIKAERVANAAAQSQGYELPLVLTDESPAYDELYVMAGVLLADEDEDEDADWDYGSLDFSHGERGKYADVTFEPLAETADATGLRDSGDEHKPGKGK